MYQKALQKKLIGFFVKLGIKEFELYKNERTKAGEDNRRGLR